MYTSCMTAPELGTIDPQNQLVMWQIIDDVIKHALSCTCTRR